MKIILRKDYEFLGGVGEIFDVKDGYARNFLIPNGIALVATESNVKAVNETKKQQGRKLEKIVDDAKRLAGIIENTPVNIEMKTGDDEKIYGSVTSQMIYDKLIEGGVPEFDKRKIVIKETIKSLGEHDIEIKLHSAVSAPVKVIVYREGGSPEDYMKKDETIEATPEPLETEAKTDEVKEEIKTESVPEQEVVSEEVKEEVQEEEQPEKTEVQE